VVWSSRAMTMRFLSAPTDMGSHTKSRCLETSGVTMARHRLLSLARISGWDRQCRHQQRRSGSSVFFSRTGRLTPLADRLAVNPHNIEAKSRMSPTRLISRKSTTPSAIFFTWCVPGRATSSSSPACIRVSRLRGAQRVSPIVRWLFRHRSAYSAVVIIATRRFEWQIGCTSMVSE
jgi:hypothetical protein